MLKSKNINNRLTNILAVIAFIMVAFIIILFSQDHSFVLGKPKILTKPYQFNGEVDIKFYDGTQYKKKVPFTITTDKPFDIVMDLNDFGLLDHKSLSFISKNVSIRCEVDGTIIYRNASSYSDSRYRDINTVYVIDLPDNVKNQVITLKYEHYNNYKTTFDFKEIKIGRKTDIISYYFLKENFINIINVLIIGITFFGIFISGSFFNKTDKMIWYFNLVAIFLVIIGVHMVSIMPLSYFVFYNSEIILHILQYSSLMLLPIPIFIACRLRVDNKYTIYFNIGVVMSTLNIIIQHVLTLLKLNTFPMMHQYSYYIIIYLIVITIYCGIKTKNNPMNKVNQMLYSLSPIFTGLLLYFILQLTKSSCYANYYFNLLIILFFFSGGYEYFQYHLENRDKRLQAELYKKLATMDKMTGLGNRMSFSEKMLEYENRNSFYCIVIDIDNLKYINDTYGHKYGDEIIITLSDMLKESFDPKYKKDMFRMGGDEFFIMYHCPETVEIDHTLYQLKTTYKESSLEEGVNNYSFSYGYSYYKGDGYSTIQEALEKADKEMYKYKKKNKLN